MKRGRCIPIAHRSLRRLSARMMETNSLQPHSHMSDSDSGETAADIRMRAERLQKKVAELSKTFDHIEQTLDKASGETEYSNR